MAPTSVVESAAVTVSMTTPGLYAEYLTDPLAANAKYKGRRVDVRGKVVSAQFVDGELAHIRMILTDGGGTGTTDSVVLCFAPPKAASACDSQP